MVSATGDWTKNTLESEYPAVRSIYALHGAADRVAAVRVDADHNYNRESREAMYGWLARWMKGAAADVVVRERGFSADQPADLLVFHGRPLPPEALTAEQITANWIREAQAQLKTTELPVRGAALRHALGSSDVRPSPPPVRRSANAGRVVLLAGAPELEKDLRGAGFDVRPVAFTPFDAAAADFNFKRMTDPNHPYFDPQVGATAKGVLAGLKADGKFAFLDGGLQTADMNGKFRR